jgi:regulator of sirC expression with transglutaminase-like and TPR domain
MAVSDQCRLILATMQTEKFLPATGGGEYYHIDNSFLHATFDGKPTIPLTLVSIFFALAEECGLTARPIGFPAK